MKPSTASGARSGLITLSRCNIAPQVVARASFCRSRLNNVSAVNAFAGHSCAVQGVRRCQKRNSGHLIERSRIQCSSTIGNGLFNVQELLNAIKGMSESELRGTGTPGTPTFSDGVFEESECFLYPRQMMNSAKLIGWQRYRWQVQHREWRQQERLREALQLNVRFGYVLSTYERMVKPPEALRGYSHEALDTLKRATTFARLLALESVNGKCLDLLRYHNCLKNVTGNCCIMATNLLNARAALPLSHESVTGSALVVTARLV